ncbi:hypothetical protein GFJ94_09215 [Flavobacterium sp. LMO8]|uniref:DUF6252 family protein n=1 Tax=Flavobacterium sp. LMO8 TaxID=2654244 RepID=UPI001291DCE5|nr:DUF6252 family protein [Flavobacterium sp. LMO8]MQP25244.1 hypothetical protein [Flavobacterium sp. LMO8]
MKKILYLLVATVLFTSCQEDIQTNTPAFQATFNNAPWRANYSEVSIGENGGLVITAYTQYETIVLKTSSANVGTYVLGTANSNDFASYDFNSPEITESYDSRVYDGPAFKLSAVQNAGTGYVANATGAQTTGGSGSGLRVATTTLNGSVTGITLVSRGIGYRAGDLITIVGGNNNARFRVVNVQQSNGEITITEALDDKYTGNFKFNVVNEDGEVVTFSEGVFYKVPLATF